MELTLAELQKEQAEFKSELAKGVEVIAKLEAQLTSIRQQMLRIEGAKMLTEKLIARETAQKAKQSEASGGTPPVLPENS